MGKMLKTPQIHATFFKFAEFGKVRNSLERLMNNSLYVTDVYMSLKMSWRSQGQIMSGNIDQFPVFLIYCDRYLHVFINVLEIARTNHVCIPEFQVFFNLVRQITGIYLRI